MSYCMSGYVVSVALLSFCFNFAIDGMSQELHRIETEWFAMTLVRRFETERFAKLPSRRHYQYFWSRFHAA